MENREYVKLVFDELKPKKIYYNENPLSLLILFDEEYFKDEKRNVYRLAAEVNERIIKKYNRDFEWSLVGDKNLDTVLINEDYDNILGGC